MSLKWKKEKEDNFEELGEAEEIGQEYGGFDYKKKQKPHVSYQQSIKYFDSAAFRKAYGSDKIWMRYRRNYKGNIMPKPRYTCTHKGAFLTNNPCPVCRDVYFVVDHRHPKLLKEFLDTNTIQVSDNQKTGVCFKQQRNLIRETELAIDRGYMEGYVPFRTYDMDYYKSLVNKPEEKEKTDVPFKILNPELLPYNIVKKHSQSRRENPENARNPGGKSNLKT
ncbi:28S ribosomal protein S18b, mitochondrial-like isoform X2 [Ostrea edulis]|nr:28S ribosomal protein S18b, mitochondrial-like isoform X2 [Ostrea edulis]